MKKRGIILASILVGLGSCYKPPKDLNFPSSYFAQTIPYVSHHDKENNFTIYTREHSKHLIEEARYKMPGLMEKVDKYFEEKRRHTVKVLVLHAKDYYQLMKNINPDKPRRWVGVGTYDIIERSINLNDIYEDFSEYEQRIFVHEYVHFRDFEDNKEDLTEEEVKGITNKILGRQIRTPFSTPFLHRRF